MISAALAFSVACLCGSGLLALRWVLSHREKKFEHLPLRQMQTKLDELEGKLLSGAMRR